jgi:hypothetical protein
MPTPPESVATTPAAAPLLVREDNVYQPVNMHHMRLLSNLFTDTFQSLGTEDPAEPSSLRFILGVSLSTPYLVDQALALSALHLSHINPGQAEEYAAEAAAFQASALSHLNSSSIEVTEDNCVSLVLFSSLLGIYTLADIVRTSRGNSLVFLDKYISYLAVHRGVRAVVDGYWDYLLSTKLSPYLQAVDLEVLDPGSKWMQACDRLHSLIDSADMGENSALSCRDAIDDLRKVYGLVSEPRARTADNIYSWPILLTVDFTSMLSKRRPEALIILAHYAVVLHRGRCSWVVGNSGMMLIEAISAQLGSYWREWLLWPNAELESDTAT